MIWTAIHKTLPSFVSTNNRGNFGCAKIELHSIGSAYFQTSNYINHIIIFFNRYLFKNALNWNNLYLIFWFDGKNFNSITLIYRCKMRTIRLYKYSCQIVFLFSIFKHQIGFKFMLCSVDMYCIALIFQKKIMDIVQK